MNYTITQEEVAWCPICDEGWVNAVRYNEADGFICGECEAWWEKTQEVATESFTQFSTRKAED